MTPCKFQMDITGTTILVQSEDRSVSGMIVNQDFVKSLAIELDLEPYSKAYAMAEVGADGKLIIGDDLPDDAF